MVGDPLKRLGSGPEGKDIFILGSDNDIESLKNHPFFKGIKFENLNQMEIPNKSKLKLKVYFKENQVKLKKISDHILEIENQKEEKKIVKEGIVKKKSPWFHYNLRKLVLYNTAILEYLEHIKNTVKVI